MAIDPPTHKETFSGTAVNHNQKTMLKIHKLYTFTINDWGTQIPYMSDVESPNLGHAFLHILSLDDANQFDVFDNLLYTYFSITSSADIERTDNNACALKGKYFECSLV